jgi:hypothetical protein
VECNGERCAKDISLVEVLAKRNATATAIVEWECNTAVWLGSEERKKRVIDSMYL